MKYLLGIDIGTTGTKTILYREDGLQCGMGYRGYELVHQRADWAEQNADDWWHAVVETVREAVRDITDPENIAALSLSTQGGSLVVVDAAGTPMMPAVSWMDRRAGKQELDALLSDKETNYHYRNTGWPLTNSFNLVQIKYLSNHQPEVFRSVAKFLSTSDYINFRLTGRFVTDHTNAGITNLSLIRSMQWDPTALKDLGISEDRLASLRPSGERIGTLTEAAAAELGIPASVVVVNGGQDQYCGAVGAGAVESGDVMLATGTAWVVLGAFSDMVLDEQGFMAPCRHVLPDRYGSMATVPAGGMAMEWFRETFREDDGQPLMSFDQINREAAQTPPGADGLRFYPHFSGATCPSWKISNRAGFIGVHLGHRRAHFARAVMEGIAVDVNKIICALRENGGQPKRIKIIGGASRSDLWCSIVTDVTGLPVIRPVQVDVPCTGAAMIAGVGAGLFADYAEAIRTFCKAGETLYPNEERMHLYAGIVADYAAGFCHLTAFYEERQK